VIDIDHTASKRRPGASGSKPSAECDIAKKSPVDQAAARIAGELLPSGSRPARALDHPASASTTTSERTSGFSSTALRGVAEPEAADDDVEIRSPSSASRAAPSSISATVKALDIRIPSPKLDLVDVALT